MYIVTPKNRPTIPLSLAKSNESIPKVARFHSLPDTPKHAKRKMVVDMHREMLAGVGFASDNATLYKTGDRVQQKLAAKTASSPITSITPALRIKRNTLVVVDSTPKTYCNMGSTNVRHILNARVSLNYLKDRCFYTHGAS